MPNETPDLPGSYPAPEGLIWHPVCSVKDVDEEEPYFTAAAGKELMVVRQGVRITVFDDRCPHIGSSMVGATVEDGQVECPLHGACFDSSNGAVLDGPTTDDLVCHAVRIVEDRVEVALPGQSSPS
ncbi:MAG: Rieske 2Fe-2S domain-containing protein [Planctomycetota bacterium]|nr:Rieske 2Fe-2S domain-containing protein [Planctomycetota bacterium]